MKNTKGIKVYPITPCDSGFGEWQRNGHTTFCKISDLTKHAGGLDGLIREQNGMTVVTGDDSNGNPILGITRHFPA